MPPVPAPPPPPADYDRFALYLVDGPIEPTFMVESVRTMMRALPLDTGEPRPWADRRAFSAFASLAALHPRDEIEVMLGVQAVAAYQAAAIGWYLAMNHHRPHGDSTRHLNGAASAARTFDTMLKALERRQAKPVSVPVGRPPCQVWEKPDPTAFIGVWIRRAGGAYAQDDPEDARALAWSQRDLRLALEIRNLEQLREDYGDLDLANTPGIRPDGSIVVPDDPTPAQYAYMARRYALNIRDKYRENVKAGIKALPKIEPFRPGDIIP